VNFTSNGRSCVADKGNDELDTDGL
jgi:hypothetical protein